MVEQASYGKSWVDFSEWQPARKKACPLLQTEWLHEFLEYLTYCYSVLHSAIIRSKTTGLNKLDISKGLCTIMSRPTTMAFIFYLFLFSCIFILLSRESDQCAIRARLGDAGHLSTTPKWGSPAKCLSQQHNK